MYCGIEFWDQSSKCAQVFEGIGRKINETTIIPLSVSIWVLCALWCYLLVFSSDYYNVDFINLSN